MERLASGRLSNSIWWAKSYSLHPTARHELSTRVSLKWDQSNLSPPQSHFFYSGKSGTHPSVATLGHGPWTQLVGERHLIGDKHFSLGTCSLFAENWVLFVHPKKLMKPLRSLEPFMSSDGRRQTKDKF